MNDCSSPDLKHVGILFAVMLLESWMGKTTLIESGSILELGIKLSLAGFKKTYNIITTKEK